MARFCLLRLRHRNVRGSLFFLDRGAEISIEPSADVIIGAGTRIMRDFNGSFQGTVRIGRDVFINRGCYFSSHAALKIGDNCLFGERVSIHDEDHTFGPGDDDHLPVSQRGFKARPITIGNNVWVGAKATILSGVRIGDGAVIGANAVVTRDVPPYTLVGGVPAREIRNWRPAVVTKVA